MTEPTQSPTIAKIIPALFKVQSQIKPAVKDSKNPFFKSTYADLASVWEACRETLHANEIFVSQRGFPVAGGIGVMTTLFHSSGEWISDSLVLPLPANATPQNGAAAVTYARRYGLSSMLGILTEDDDGNEASKPAVNSTAKAIKAAVIAPVVAPKPDPGWVAVTRAALEAAINQAPTLADLKSLIPDLQTLPEADQAALKPVYQARKAALA